MSLVATLTTGLRVVSRRWPVSKLPRSGCFADCGSRHEPAEHNGLAHALEHMVFKGAGGVGPRAQRND
jgi:predicted Zn-dependent peptidase